MGKAVAAAALESGGEGFVELVATEYVVQM